MSRKERHISRRANANVSEVDINGSPRNVLTNSLGLLIPENGHSEASNIIGISLVVELLDKLGVVERVRVSISELPAAFVQEPVHGVHGDDALETLQCAQEKCTMGLVFEGRMI